MVIQAKAMCYTVIWIVAASAQLMHCNNPKEWNMKKKVNQDALSLFAGPRVGNTYGLIFVAIRLLLAAL